MATSIRFFSVESCFHIHNALYFPLQGCFRHSDGIWVMVYKRHIQTIGWVYEYHNMTETIVNHTHPGGDLELVDGTNTNHSVPTLLLGGSGDASASKYGLVWLGLKISIKIYNFDDMTCGYTKDSNMKHSLYIFVNTLQWPALDATAYNHDISMGPYSRHLYQLGWYTSFLRFKENEWVSLLMVEYIFISVS